GIDRTWFEHAAPEVVRACNQMVDQLKNAGAEIREIAVPWLDEMRIAHVITILSEMAISMRAYQDERKLHGAAVRLSLVLGEAFTATDYVQAQ
ncbi:hypothetical protein, partial [Escherichia coli]|uniref:hypothetical protein n=1 Tax=Escherichia coli TaxID=562 RepID=UPI003F44E58A